VADRERNAAGECGPVRRGRTVSGRLVVIVVLLAGGATASVVCWVAFANRESKKRMMSGPEVGAGAGHTGMYNEYGGVGKKPAGGAK
jgi:hypothetical protein